MEPQIQYARTSDGVSIAFWTLGSGFPLVYLPPVPLHLQLDWTHPSLRQLYEWLARGRRMIRYDFRGRGMSQHGEFELIPEERAADLDAVLTKTGIEHYDLVSHGSSARIAVERAVAHPEQVRKLVLIDVVAPVPESMDNARIRALTATLEYDWDTFTELASYMIWGWSSGPLTRKYAEIWRASMTWEQAKREFRNALPDMSDVLPRISAPTLVIDHLDAVLSSTLAARRLAADIPNAQLCLLEGMSVGGAYTDPLMIAAVDQFLGDGGTGAAGAMPTSLPAGMAVIVFADIAGSTELTERMGDAAFRDASRALDEQLRAAIRAAGGNAVEGKVLGDGVMGVFGSAAQAIDAALRCRTLSAQSELRLHIGLHAGDVIREEHNVFGGAVNIASRVCGLSEPGEILVSATVRDLARTSATVSFDDRGERTLKGIDDPVRVFSVSEQR